MKTFVIIISTILVLFVGYISFVPAGRAMINNYSFTMKKVDDATLYKKRKVVEDTCRAMLASYQADKLTYEQYKDDPQEEHQNWANAAKMRANKTASTYNNYILQNSFVWQDNVPADIYREFAYIE